MDLLYLTPGSDDPKYLKELRLEPPHGFEEPVFVAGLRRAAERTSSAKVQRAVNSLTAAVVWRGARETDASATDSGTALRFLHDLPRYSENLSY